MLKIKIMAIILLLVITSPSFAGGGYVGSAKISFMQNAYGGWIMSTTGVNNNPDNCSNNSIILNWNHAQYKEIYSFLLSSYVAGKPINIYVNGCHSAGYKILDFVFSNWG